MTLKTDQIGAGDKFVMDIRTDYEVTVDGTTYGGFVKGADAIKGAMNAIETQDGINNKIKQNIADNTKIFSDAGLTNSAGFLTDWKAGWNELWKQMTRK